MSLRTTPLVDWHRAEGAKLTAFAGWEMPVNYSDGIIAEHLATRTHATLFDICHMGRFLVEGPRAEAFLSSLLTNDASALVPGRAHYTFLATDAGGARDDAYLYRLAPERFLLVVNAANAPADWEWIEATLGGETAVTLTDVTEELGMIALQGPLSARLIGDVFGNAATSLADPSSGRNEVAQLPFSNGSAVVARTGYTGETVGFELFPHRDDVLPLWEALSAAGARPAGLGARDSLRLEAGLPLYGHELGPDPEGGEIRIFANDSARFGVRPAAADPRSRLYPGQAALEAQRNARRAILTGDPAGGRALLPRLIRPLASFETRRPLRAGFRLLREGREVGRVTSGTVAPYTPAAERASENDEARPHLRPIGLALVDAELGTGDELPLTLEARDPKNRTQTVQVVARNLLRSGTRTLSYRPS